jgi:hypothetical protein
MWQHSHQSNAMRARSKEWEPTEQPRGRLHGRTLDKNPSQQGLLQTAVHAVVSTVFLVKTVVLQCTRSIFFAENSMAYIK